MQETIFISFQNGLGNEELIGEVVGENKVLGGLTAQVIRKKAHSEFLDVEIYSIKICWRNLDSNSFTFCTSSREPTLRVLATFGPTPT